MVEMQVLWPSSITYHLSVQEGEHGRWRMSTITRRQIIKHVQGSFIWELRAFGRVFSVNLFLSTDVNKIRREPLLLSALLQAQKWKVWEFEDSSKSGSDVSITRGPAYSRLCLGAAS